ncbi:Gag-Pol polyprotein [Nosema granulosis]|uniref:Gag-Pol polyprotein n=1 Tax=Nosema granulosis TaxID=83296 RepID=A0A9P6KXL0_9MICR|nr:Gag-Pol polyprotein [Nosema granulosis]
MIEKCILQNIVKKYGIPSRILSDCGLEFKNKKMGDLSARLGIKWDFASPAHHQTVGGVERANQTLWQKIRKVSDFGSRKWETVVAQATHAVNISYNRSIGTSPFILKYGKLPDLPIDTKLGFDTSRVNHRTILNNVLKRRESYERDITKGKIATKANLSIGDSVCIYKQKLSNKLEPEWIDGFTIIGMVEPDAFVVTNGTAKLRLNKSHIKRDSTHTR